MNKKLVDNKKDKLVKNKATQLEDKNILKKYLNKVNVTYFLLFLFDVVLVIYLARKNNINYVEVLDEEILVGKMKYLFLGRNYINVVVILFFYIYICLINRFFLHRKNTVKFLLLSLVVLVILNILLFILFSKRVY